MKKYFLLMLTAVSALGVCSSCDNDKDDNANFPTGQIASDNLALNLNGTAATGTVTVKATGGHNAQITFADIIPGYSSVAVDVKMESQAGGAYSFTGSKSLETAPVRSTEAKPAFLTVVVQGTVSADGKYTINLTTSGVASYAGTYTDATLKLTYGGTELTGKTVVIATSEDAKLNIQLIDIIPGDAVTMLMGVEPTETGFSGTTTTSAATVNYNGSLSGGVLTLAVTVEMNDPDRWVKSYLLADFELIPQVNAPLTSACYAEVVSPSTDYVQMQFAARGILGGILPRVLKNVTFAKDGNITADYSSDALDIPTDFAEIASWAQGGMTQAQIDALVAARTYTESPKNFAFWFNKDGKLYVKINIYAIVAQKIEGEMAPTILGLIKGILSSDLATIKTLLGQLAPTLDPEIAQVLQGLLQDDATLGKIVSWIQVGFPLNVTIANGHTHVYLDKTDMATILPLVNSLSGLFMGELPPAIQQPVSNLLQQIAGGLPSATTFNLGLDLVAAQ